MRNYSIYKYILIIILSMITIMTCGCGHVKPASELEKTAKNKYGDCTLLSVSESKEKTVINLHDELQDFDYEFKSEISDITIDGSIFGPTSSESNNFREALKNKVIENVKDTLDNICLSENCTYEIGDSDILIYIYAPDNNKGKIAAINCAKALQEQNIDSRLNGMTIYVGTNKYESFYSNELFGSVELPDMKWSTTEDENIEFFTEIAHSKTDKSAVFLRTEEGTFGETGADLQRVVNVLGTNYPTTNDSKVIFYYFKSSNGKEYYICDFNYYIDETYNTFTWYTDYK